MGIILSSTAALALLLQLATQLAAAAFAFLVSTNQTQVLHQSMICIPSLQNKKKKEKVPVFFYRFLCERKIDRISLDFCAKKVNFFGFFLYRFLCIRMIAYFFNGFFPGCKIYCQISIDFCTGGGGGGGGGGRGGRSSVFSKKNFNLENFVLFLFKKKEDYRSREEDLQISTQQSSWDNLFQFSFLILEFQSPNGMNTKQLHMTKYFECFYYYNDNVSTLFCFVVFWVKSWFFLGHQNLDKTQFQCFFWVHLFCFAMRFLVSKNKIKKLI
jgi:hypothetical protein